MPRYHSWLMGSGLIGCALVAVPAPAAAQWELLGARRVSFAAERDVIAVGAREGLFNAVKIDVDGGNLEMYDVRLTFGDGSSWSPETRVLFREGSRSRTIDLPGAARVIRRIEFAYRSTMRRGRATVRAYGRSVGPGVGPAQQVGVGTGAAGAWEHLGARPVDFRVDHDAIGALAQGRFRSIRIDVEGGDLEMFDVTVVFGNGEKFSPATRLYFQEGSRSRVIDLPGQARLIRRIAFFYRSVAGGGQGKAIVHVYGRP